MSTETQIDAGKLVERFTLKAFVECCLMLEEGVSTHREIDLAMMMGSGMIPGPFAKADLRGLDDVLGALERAQSEWGDTFAPPMILRRLVTQGRLGAKSGQGFYPYPRPDEGYGPEKAVKLETRGPIAIAWIDSPPANALSPKLIEELEAVWEKVQGAGDVRALIVTSPNPTLFSAGADIKAFTQMDEQTGRELLARGHALLRSLGQSRIVTIAAVNAIALGGGNELAMACDIRLAGRSATFGQPEINLGIMPGFGGTQRLPRLVGEAKALEMNLTAETISADEAEEKGLVHRVTADHELFDAALAWARKLAEQPPIAVEQIKRASAKGDLDVGIEAEKEAFATAFASQDAKEGFAAFVGKRKPSFQGR